MELANLVEILRARKTVLTPDSAQLSLHILELLADAQPVSPERLAEKSGQSVESIHSSFAALQTCGCEFNEEGNLIGDALSLSPTCHRFRIRDHDFYAWCALDTLFLPALLKETAEISSTCPQTGEALQLRVSPSGIESANPSEIALSIVFSQGCTSGINGSFCGQIHFFASAEAAQLWVKGRADFVVLSLAEAFEVAHQVYVEPLMQQINQD
jgi:alkylmercury lyase